MHKTVEYFIIKYLYCFVNKSIYGLPHYISANLENSMVS